MRIRKISPYLFLLPSLLLFCTFILYPIVYTFIISFYKWDGLTAMEFVGLSNYAKLINDATFLGALANNIKWTAIFVVVPIALGLIIATVLNSGVKGASIFKSIIILPMVFSFVVAGIIWSYVFDPDIGSLNAIFRGLGLGFLAHPWLGDPATALYSIIFAAVWLWTGFCTLIFLAGLQGIPKEILEAAKIDGATAWQEFRYLSLPMLRPQLIIVIVMAVMSSFKVFDLVFVTTRGGPYFSSEVIANMLYREAFTHFKMGYGAAISVVMFLIIMTVSIVYIRRMTRVYEY